MAKILTFLCAISVTTALYADSLQLKNGSVLQNVKIIAADPERMLVVHTDGAEQIAYTDLKPGSLTAEQRQLIENGLQDYAEREAQREELRLNRETLQLQENAFRREQAEKGLVEFEGNWITPEERRQILTNRDRDRAADEQRETLADLRRENEELRREIDTLAEEVERLRETSTRVYYAPYYYARPSSSHRHHDSNKPRRHDDPDDEPNRFDKPDSSRQGSGWHRGNTFGGVFLEP